MRRRLPYGEPYLWMAMTMAQDQEAAVHPALSQALAAEHVRDMLARAAARDLARAARHDGRGRVSRAHTLAPQTSHQASQVSVPSPRAPQPELSRVPAGVGASSDEC